MREGRFRGGIASRALDILATASARALLHARGVPRWGASGTLWRRAVSGTSPHAQAGAVVASGSAGSGGSPA